LNKYIKILIQTDIQIDFSEYASYFFHLFPSRRGRGRERRERGFARRGSQGGVRGRGGERLDGRGREGGRRGREVQYGRDEFTTLA
jgi:hypothetical protein